MGSGKRQGKGKEPGSEAEASRARRADGGGKGSAIVRRAGVSDADAVIELRAEMMRLHAELDARFRPAPEGAHIYREEYLRWLSDIAWRVLVAERAGRVVGYTVGTVQVNPAVIRPRHIGYVTDICVAEGERGSGIGRLLVNGLLDWFRARGLRVVQLRALSRNPDSRAFWRRMGWEEFMAEMWLSLEDGGV